MKIKPFNLNKMYLKPALFYVVVFVVLFNSACQFSQKLKIVYINSYHAGHPSSDEIMQGFMQNMPADSFEIHSFYMDTKRNTSAKYIENKANALLDSILNVNPKVLVVSDDNAVKYIVEPNLDKLKMPVVYCGVNWTAEAYQLPRKQVTGILEILPVAHAIELLKQSYPKAKKLLVLNENTTTSRKEKDILERIFQNEKLSVSFKLVNNFQEWEAAFLEGNKEYDLIYFSTRAAIKHWEQDKAIKVISENIKVPVFTCEDFMMPYAVFGVTKIAEEHGTWAAATVKEILNGKSPAEIPVSKNKEVASYINLELAKKIDFNWEQTQWENALQWKNKK